MDPADLHALYHRTLLDDVIPFWTTHAIDANGGINTCIGDDGIVASRDRWNWSQWRAVWVFAKLYNAVEPRPEWLVIAQGIHDFVVAHGPLPDGHWPLLLSGEGQLQRGYESIYVDGFALFGLTELWHATGDAAVLDRAMSTFRVVEDALLADTPPPTWPYPTAPGLMTHGVSMIFSIVFHELAQATGDPAVRAAADREHRKVMDVFLRPQRGLVLEWLSREGREIAPPKGTAVIPGHAIESMWFQMHIARDAGDTATLDRAVAAIRRHLEIGWDSECGGGLLLAVDAEGGDEVGWPYGDTKLWWPHTEALYATLLAYEHRREPWCLEWHERVRQYAYAHFPVPQHGEWRQKLDRQGNPITDIVALPVKDPFHLPRALITCLDVLDRLIAAG